MSSEAKQLQPTRSWCLPAEATIKRSLGACRRVRQSYVRAKAGTIVQRAAGKDSEEL